MLLRSRHFLSQIFRLFHSNIRSWVENECCYPRTINISNVNFIFKKAQQAVCILYGTQSTCITWPNEGLTSVTQHHTRRDITEKIHVHVRCNNIPWSTHPYFVLCFIIVYMIDLRRFMYITYADSPSFLRSSDGKIALYLTTAIHSKTQTVCMIIYLHLLLLYWIWQLDILRDSAFIIWSFNHIVEEESG